MPSELEPIIVELRSLAIDIADAGINGFGNRVTDVADQLERLVREADSRTPAQPAQEQPR